MLIVLTALSSSSEAQTFKVLYTFTGFSDGTWPEATLTMDKDGNLYGTTRRGGSFRGGCEFLLGCGVVFKLEAQGPSNWRMHTIYHFQSVDGGFGPGSGGPLAQVVVGPDGALYGTTVGGWSSLKGVGVVFKLSPVQCGSSDFCPWPPTVLHQFHISDGALPSYQFLLFDRDGNLYGTTVMGGLDGQGVVFRLTPTEERWSESVLYNFDWQGGGEPSAGVIADSLGSLYGTAYGGEGGTVFRLWQDSNNWNESVLHQFPGSDGPRSLLVMDEAGNLYGTTRPRSDAGGTVYMLQHIGSSWVYSLLYAWPLRYGGPSDSAGLVRDNDGNLYGTVVNTTDSPCGTVFKLAPRNGTWVYTDLYRFRCEEDGGYPWAGLALSPDGKLYGTNLGGVIFEITLNTSNSRP